MIDTMKITVTTPTLTPRIVSAERSLLARNVSSAMTADSLMSSSLIPLLSSAQRKPSFRAKRFNRIELRGAPRRPQSAHNPHHRRNTNTQHRRSHADQQRKPDQRRNYVSQSKSCCHTKRAANRRHRHRFDQKLRQDVFASRANRLANTDLLRPLGHRHQHDIHHYDPTNDERDRGHANRDDVDVRSRGTIEVKKHVLCFHRETFIFSITGGMTAVAHDRAHLIFSGFELLRRVYLNKRDQRTPGAVCLLISRIRNIDHVIAREPEYRTQRLEHAENEIRPAVNADLLAHCPVSRRVVKEVFQHVRTNDADLASGSAFTLGPDPADIDRYAIDIKHRDRIDAAYAHVLRLLIRILHRLDRICGDANTPARRTQPRNRFRIFVRHVFAAVELDEVFARLDDLRVLRNREDSRTL